MEPLTIQRFLRKEKISLWLITGAEGSDPNSEFLLGAQVSARHAVLVPARGRPVAILSDMEASAHVPKGFQKLAFSSLKEFRKLLQSQAGGARSIALDFVRRPFHGGSRGYDFLTHSEFSALRALLPKARFVSSVAVQDLRSVRSKDELRNHRRAIAITAKALKTVMREGAVGLSEKKVASRIKQVFLEEAAGEAFPAIVASGPNSANPHHSPTDRRIRKGEPLLIDLGARWKMCCADVTRTYWLGGKPGGEPSGFFSKVYSTVQSAQSAAIGKILPGARGKDINAAADRILLSGFDKRHVLHSLGHPVGGLVHDVGPSLHKKESASLKAGMIVAVEPGLYFKGKFGVRIEDDVLVGKRPAVLSIGIPKPEAKPFKSENN